MRVTFLDKCTKKMQINSWKIIVFLYFRAFNKGIFMKFRKNIFASFPIVHSPTQQNMKNIHSIQLQNYSRSWILMGGIAILFAILLLFAGKKLYSSSSSNNQNATAYPNCYPNCKAMVVSAHREASEAGVKILEQGGNAVDAAIAVQFALAVTFPAAGNLGGGGFMVFRQNDGQAFTLDYREKAPAKASRDMYLDKNKNVIEGLSLHGQLAAGVPGTVAGLFASHKRFGKLEMSKLIQPAIELAENGFYITEKDAASFNNALAEWKKYNTKSNVFTSTAKWTAGMLLKQPDLAKTLKLIQQNGQAGFYEGETADKIVAEMKRGNGIISLEDLKNYEAVWREPLHGKYKEYDLISMGPPSSGGIALFQLLKMVEPYDIPQNSWHSTQTTHLMVEAERRVYADRATHLGDMDFYPVPILGLLQEEYIKGRMKNYNPQKASPSSTIKAGTPSKAQKEETTHLSVVDADGNAVAVTTTLNGAYGNAVVVGDAGFFLNNEMDDFSIKPGTPNYYGLIGAEANKIEPQKRMLSSMTPTILTKNGKLFMVVGTPGGATIITSVFQTILNVIEHKMDMQKAVSAPRFHSQWLPDKISHERDAFDAKGIEALKKMGHTLDARSPIGRVDAILVREDGTLEGGADPRGDDAAVGY